MAEAYANVVGNLTADPSLRFTQSGHAVADFTVASTPRTKVNGDWADGETLFIRVSVWRNLAEGVSETLRKGDEVTVYGKLRQRSFEKDNVKRTVIELEGESVGKSARSRGGSGQAQVQPAADAWGTQTEAAPF